MAGLHTQDTAVVVSPACLLHLLVSACARCLQRQSIQGPSPIFKMQLQVSLLATAIFDPDVGSGFQLFLRMTAGKSLGSDCLKVSAALAVWNRKGSL